MPAAASKPKFEKTKQVNSDLASVVSDCFQQITDLGDEFREIYDNAPENLQQNDVNQTRDTTASAVEGLSEPDVPDGLGGIDVSYTEDNGKVYRGRQNQSRACRASNAAAGFRACSDALSQWLEDNPELDDDITADEKKTFLEAHGGYDADDYQQLRDEAETLQGECDEIADEIEGMEWPGMFG